MKKINPEEFKKIVSESYTYADICRKIGWKPQGGNYKYVKRYIKELSLDISHFTGKATNIGNRLNCENEKKSGGIFDKKFLYKVVLFKMEIVFEQT